MQLSHSYCSSFIKSIVTISILLLFILPLIHNVATTENLGDPYRILGVDKKASSQEIRRAYKQLAKEWHPDKSKDPDAEQKFVEIKQAYELLADSERRKAYDLHGITNEDAHLYRDRHDYSQYGRFSFDPFEEFFGSHRFTFHDQDISLFHKLVITAKYYENQVVPKSHNTPHILLFYADWCFSCMKAAGAFKKLIDSLEPLGVVFATINAGVENQLVRRVGVHSLPCISLVLDGHNYLYKENVLSVPKVVDFVRLKLPYKLIGNIKDSNVDVFLNGWTDNRVRSLILEPRSIPRLRYLIAAYHFRQQVAFGFVQLNSPDTTHIQHRYKVNPSLDSLLIFNEDPSKPAASVSMSDIPSQTLNVIIKVNQYLALPRLSSQEMLDGICPAEWSRPRKRLCVILVTENTESHDQARETLRRIALQSSYSAERVRFAYIYQNKQFDFINSLSAHGKPQETLLRIVVIWRRDTKHIKYEWIHETDLHVNEQLENETYEHAVNKTKQKLDTVIQKLLRPSEALSYEAEVKDLLDEHAQGLLFRIITKLYTSLEYFFDNLGSEHIWPALSVVATVLFILGIGYLMSYLVKMEEENIKRNASKDHINNNDPLMTLLTCNLFTGPRTNNTYVPELKLHELRAEKYNGLIRLLKPGCRTIVLITDLQSRPKLIPAYHRAVWPYRKNKTLMFAHMLIEKGLSWYSELLRLSLSESRDLNINPRNCIGTVIALNGHRKYFCMYHAKHPESSRGAKRMIKMTRHLSVSPADPEAGAFLGMDSDDSDVSTDISEPKILLEENLLDGLSNWLDRLFEGTTHRYYINYWPDFTTK